MKIAILVSKYTPKRINRNRFSKISSREIPHNKCVSILIFRSIHNIDFQIDTRMIKFIHSCLNHSNIVCKSIVLSKLYCIKSTIGSNYKYLSCKYGISQDDWYTNLSQLFKKVNMKCHEEMQHRNAAQTVVELCAIRDGVADCDTLSYNNVCNLIDLISLD